MGRIPQWTQESPSSPYIRRGNVLETCRDFFDQRYVEVLEDRGEVYTIIEDAGSVHTCVEECERMWKDMEDHEMWESSLESSMVVL